MTTNILKKKLSKAINSIEDVGFLRALHTIVQSREEVLFELTPSQKKELDKRMANHLSGKSNSYSWAQVKRTALKK